MYRSGQSIFARPKPIDLSAARRAGVGLDMELDLSDDESDGLLFDAENGQHSTQRGPVSDMPRAVQGARDEWAELG
jgi:hypothetical protein